MIIVSRTVRVDWPRVVGNLRRVGLSMQGIADALDVSRSSLYAWAGEDESTGEPAHWTGQALIALWCDRTGLQWSDLPTRVVTPSVAEVLRG